MGVITHGNHLITGVYADCVLQVNKRFLEWVRRVC